jgi:tryptophanase
MREFEFTLKFSLPDLSVDPSEYIEALGAEGCDDALIGVGQVGRVALGFTRYSKSALDAISSAAADVKCAIPGAKLVEATPDLVDLTDVADIVGCSRRYMRKLMVTSGPSFPAPVHEGRAALWRLSKVLVYLRDSKQYQIEDTLLDVASTNMQFNVTRESQEIDPVVQKDIHPLIS